MAATVHRSACPTHLTIHSRQSHAAHEANHPNHREHLGAHRQPGRPTHHAPTRQQDHKARTIPTSKPGPWIQAELRRPSAASLRGSSPSLVPSYAEPQQRDSDLAKLAEGDRSRSEYVLSAGLQFSRACRETTSSSQRSLCWPARRLLNNHCLVGRAGLDGMTGKALNGPSCGSEVTARGWTTSLPSPSGVSVPARLDDGPAVAGAGEAEVDHSSKVEGGHAGVQP